MVMLALTSVAEKLNIRLKGSLLLVCIIGLAACEQPPSLLQAYNVSTQQVELMPSDVNWAQCPTGPTQCAIIEGSPHRSGPFTMRVKMPAGHVIPPHWHPGIEHITVIDGLIDVVLGADLSRENAKQYPAGGYLVVPANRPMAAWASEDAIIQIHSVGPWVSNLITQE